MRDLSEELKSLRARLDEAQTYLKLDELRARRPQLEAEASRPDLWDDADRARQVTGELSHLNDDIGKYERFANDPDVIVEKPFKETIVAEGSNVDPSRDNARLRRLARTDSPTL